MLEKLISRLSGNLIVLTFFAEEKTMQIEDYGNIDFINKFTIVLNFFHQSRPPEVGTPQIPPRLPSAPQPTFIE